MTKNVKIAAIVSAAALLAVGASMTSFAAGWTEENGTWRYYDRNGDAVTQEWEKSGENWYYLNDDGEMTIDSIVEDNDNYYYVDANGAMVTNNWVEIENEDAGDDENQPNTWWYYFGSNGKAYKQGNSDNVSLKTINGKKYAFNEEAQMLFGWVTKDGEMVNSDDEGEWQDGVYYFGDSSDGAMTVGWKELAIYDGAAEDEQPGDNFWDEDQVRWFYFKSSGKKQGADNGKTINGKKYAFDAYGRMVADWYAATVSDASASAANDSDYSSTFMYFSSPEDGARYTKGWFKVTPGYYLNTDKYNDGDEAWYYADGKGHIYADQIKTINGKKYAFRADGRMMSGLVFLTMETTAAGKVSSTDIEKRWADDDDNDPYDTEENFDNFVLDPAHAADITSGKLRCYYFGDSSDGSMKTGKNTVTIDGDSFTFQFEKSSSKKGAGLTKIDDHKFYLAGKLVKADKDDKVDIIVADSNGDYVEKLSASDLYESPANYVVGTVDLTSGYDITTNSDKVKYEGYKLDTNYKYYLVNTSGALVKSGNKKDDSDYRIRSNKSYEIYTDGTGLCIEVDD